MEARNCEDPTQTIAVGAVARHRGRHAHRDSCLAHRFGVSFKIVRLHAEIDYAAAFFESVVPGMPSDRIQERDQFEVGVVGEGDERVVRSDVVPASTNHGKAGGRVVSNCGFQFRDNDHQVIDRRKHPLLPSLGCLYSDQDRFIADQLAVFIKRVERLLAAANGQGWSADDLASVKFIHGSALLTFGKQTGKNLPLEEATVPILIRYPLESCLENADCDF